MSCYALIMAAGCGSRMGLEMNKALYPLAGKAVLARSVEAFETLVDGVVIVAREADMGRIHALSLRARIVHGGDTRQRSVLLGLRALPADAEIVLVHDAARPFAGRGLIERCVASARAFGSGVAAIPIQDTIKRVGADGVIVETPARETLYAAQTPQAFAAAKLLRAIERLEALGITTTDDAAALEAAGEAVRIVPGEAGNIKLTRPEDLRFAEFILRGEARP